MPRSRWARPARSWPKSVEPCRPAEKTITTPARPVAGRRDRRGKGGAGRPAVEAIPTPPPPGGGGRGRRGEGGAGPPAVDRRPRRTLLFARPSQSPIVTKRSHPDEDRSMSRPRFRLGTALMVLALVALSL